MYCTYDRIEREKIMSTSVLVFFCFLPSVFFFFFLSSLHTLNLQSIIVQGQLAKPFVNDYHKPLELLP